MDPLDALYGSTSTPIFMMLNAGSAGVINLIPGAQAHFTDLYRGLYESVLPTLTPFQAETLRNNIMSWGWW